MERKQSTPTKGPQVDWTKPQPVSDVLFAFPANVIGTLLPPEGEIPKELWDWNDFWHQMASQIFNFGTSKNIAWLRSGLEPAEVVRHTDAVLRSFQPKHQHKIAGVAYLLSLWFQKENPDAEAVG